MLNNQLSLHAFNIDYISILYLDYRVENTRKDGVFVVKNEFRDKF